MENIQIHQVKSTDVGEVLPYVIECRKLLFPMLDPDVLPKDLEFFEEIYLQTQTGAFLQAQTSEGNRIGVIGMMPYDYRFPHLQINKQPTVEVARLFVEPEFRRAGLATLLFQNLQKLAKQKEVHNLYLHTHPFLPGAYEFWLRQGFSLIDSREEAGFPTLHMENVLLTAPESTEKK